MKWEPLEQTRISGIESLVLGKPSMNEERNGYILPLGVRITGADSDVVVSMLLPLIDRASPEDYVVTFKLYLQAALMTLKAFVEKGGVHESSEVG